MAGAEGTFSLLTIFGSADDPGKITRDLHFWGIFGEQALPKGTKVNVSLSRWETFVVPALKVFIRL